MLSSKIDAASVSARNGWGAFKFWLIPLFSSDRLCLFVVISTFHEFVTCHENCYVLYDEPFSKYFSKFHWLPYSSWRISMQVQGTACLRTSECPVHIHFSITVPLLSYPYWLSLQIPTSSRCEHLSAMVNGARAGTPKHASGNLMEFVRDIALSKDNILTCRIYV